MIYEFKNYNKYGNVRTRLIPYPDGKPFKVSPKGLGKYIGVKVHKYEYKHPNLAPTLFTTEDGRKFMVPMWEEVLPETTLNDIIWIKPKVKSKVKKESPTAPNKYKFESKSAPGSFYEVTVKGEDIKCNCSGFWRVKDKSKGCKHAQQVRKELKK